MPATSFATGTSDTALLEETIDANLRRTVSAWPDREAVVDAAAGVRLTYTELDRRVDDVARGLIARDIAKGDRVGIWSPNCLEWFLVQYAQFQQSLTPSVAEAMVDVLESAGYSPRLIEPSCTGVLRSEALALLNNEASRDVAAATHTLAELLLNDAEWQAPDLKSRLSAVGVGQRKGW